MSEPNVENGQNPETGFEQQDLSARGIFSFLLGLAIFGVLVHFVLNGMYAFLDGYERQHQPPLNPLVSNVPTDTREVPPEARLKFPQPRLEVSERTDLGGFRFEEENKLNSYGWVDQKAGIVRIPIERAMQLVAERGLPTRSQTTAPAQASGSQPKNKPQTRDVGRGDATGRR